ncbi:unnamed protein product, partial [Ectocarpus sp. 8 AP-2014]
MGQVAHIFFFHLGEEEGGGRGGARPGFSMLRRQCFVGGWRDPIANLLVESKCRFSSVHELGSGRRCFTYSSGVVGKCRYLPIRLRPRPHNKLRASTAQKQRNNDYG